MQVHVWYVPYLKSSVTSQYHLFLIQDQSDIRQWLAVIPSYFMIQRRLKVLRGNVLLTCLRLATVA